jgi:hypothetical protein
VAPRQLDRSVKITKKALGTAPHHPFPSSTKPVAPSSSPATRGSQAWRCKLNPALLTQVLVSAATPDDTQKPDNESQSDRSRLRNSRSVRV